MNNANNWQKKIFKETKIQLEITIPSSAYDDAT